ncbi:MAG: copper resistance protein B, partial [Dokdonella sp.]
DYSDGVEAAHMHGLHKHGVVSLGSVMVDQLEVFSGDGSSGQAIDMQAWYGGDLNKLWFKAESERSDGRQGATRIEALWNHAYAAYWGAQVGLRHDVGEGPSRDWVAFGVQGLAPYWFEVEATAYVGEAGRTALRLEAEYELLLTQRLILQPDVELNVYGKDDPARGIGSGLSDLDVGLRLRYEFTRKFAPYVGVVWSRKFGGTADFARAEGGGAEDTQVVAGLRIWF